MDLLFSLHKHTHKPCTKYISRCIIGCTALPSSVVSFPTMVWSASSSTNLFNAITPPSNKQHTLTRSQNALVSSITDLISFVNILHTEGFIRKALWKDYTTPKRCVLFFAFPGEGKSNVIVLRVNVAALVCIYTSCDRGPPSICNPATYSGLCFHRINSILFI